MSSPTIKFTVETEELDRETIGIYLAAREMERAITDTRYLIRKFIKHENLPDHIIDFLEELIDELIIEGIQI